MRLVFPILVVAAFLREGAGQPDACSPGGYVALSQGSPLPPTLPKSFVSMIEANLIDRKMTVDSRELVDELNDIVEIEERANLPTIGPTTYTEIFDFKNNQVIVVMRIGNATSTCNVQDVTSSNDRYLFGELKPSGSGQVFSTQGAMYLSSKFPSVYKGPTTSRGIDVEEWENCIYMDANNGPFKANWHFTAANGWNTAMGISQIPVTLHVRGNIKDTRGAIRSIDHVYEFVHFRPLLQETDRRKDVQLPPHAVCPALKGRRPMPKIPEAFTFIAEISIPTYNLVSTIREAYDSKMMLGRYDYTIDLKGNEVFEVHDWTTGIAYVTNKVYGNCTIMPIPAGSFDSQATENGKVRMRTSKEFFGIDDKTTYQYAGRRLIRDIPTDVFTALKVDESGTATVWELGFTIDGISLTGGPVSLEVNEPIYIGIRSVADDRMLQVYHLIGFDESQPNIERFQIGNCFDSDQMTHLSFRVGGSYADIVEKNHELFRYLTLLSLISYTAVSPIRINRMRVYGPNDAIIVSFSLLDPPPIELSDLCSDCPRRRNNEPSEDVIALLKDAIDSNKFIIKADTTNVNQLVTLKAVPGSLVVGLPPQATAAPLVKLDGGAAAGLGIGLFFTGILVTVLALFVLVKIRGNNLPTFVKGFVPQTFGSESSK